MKTKTQEQYGLKEMFTFKCLKCGERRTIKEFFFTPLGLCDKCDKEEIKEALKEL